MEAYEEITRAIALSMGAAWASGINLYATILVLGALGATQNIVLPEHLHILMNPLVMTGAGLMFVAEFIAADAGIGYSIRIALYQSNLSRILIALFLIGITLAVYQGFLEFERCKVILVPNILRLDLFLKVGDVRLALFDQ